MRTWAAVFALCTGLIWGQSVLAQGTARSLDIQPGARQNALGAAGVALEGDPSDALWWNPAALGFAEWQGASYTHAMLVPGLADDVVYQHVAAGAAIGRRFGIGVSGTFLSYGELEWYPFEDDESTEWSLAAALGYRVLPELAVGVTAKRVKVALYPGLYEGSTFAFDIGSLYRTDLDPVRLSAGFNVQNVGPEMSFEGFADSDKLSRNFKVGGAVTLPVVSDNGLDAEATLVADFNQSLVTNKFRTYNIGTETCVGSGKRARIAVRAGYYYDPLGDIGDVTYGAGIRIAGATVDFGAVPQARDSGLERVTKWSFGLQTDLLLEWLEAR
jgi:hypothetical protein